ncbi:MAG: glucose-6-phosphate dehydrogenase [candidate division NC10 bacterium]|nr:glucose-6-phosphate dehydrogenase [candidate division NC10 bacterium]
MSDRPLPANPLREGLRLERTPEPCVLVIFGASGDLAQRKLVPALYSLARDHRLPAAFAVIGMGRTPLSAEAFRDQLREGVADHARYPVDPALWESFARGLSYVAGDPRDHEAYGRLRAELERLDRERGTEGRRVFYLAVPPSVVGPIVRNLERAGLHHASPPGWVRVVIEKPFGTDLASARALNREILQVLGEESLYRIDHYLGKETVQNLLVFRFANGIFEPTWNRRYVDHVQITVAEEVGVEGRGGYYEEAGAVRDMMQNHLLQLLALVAMEPPSAFEAEAVRGEKVKVLRAIRPLAPAEIGGCAVRGQYGRGTIAGEPVPAYREEPGVAPDSATETFAALMLYVDTWRWGDVPFYLRSGKRLPRRATEIAVQFRRVPHPLFGREITAALAPNVLALRIQPDEGITLTFGAKVPGPALAVRPVQMDFRYGSAFAGAGATAYERLLLDCMLGDATLFIRGDEVEASWAAVTPVLEAWAAEPPGDFPNYEAGTWGPKAAEEMLAREGRRWRRL